MRIAIFTSSSRRRGGAETYVASLLTDFAERGCDLALVHENDAPVTHEPMALPSGTPAWNAGEIGKEAALDRLTAWRPDVIFSQGGTDVDFEAALSSVAPTVLFAHNYSGTCVSGTKTVRYPVRRPCDRAMGLACLAHYYPRRCGGLSPATMLREYILQRRRSQVARSCRAIVTGSEHMRSEYLRQGMPAERVFVVPFRGPKVVADSSDRHEAGSRPWRLLFVGRMEELKGGALLLRALPRAARHLGRALHLTLVGTGRAEARWRREADRLDGDSRVRIEFTGWLPEAELHGPLSNADLLVVPSIWPEPFGLIGLEGAAHGVPAVAFDVGGIPEWLTSGENGFLAPGAPATSAGLADAIVAALRDEATWRRLRDGARAVARRYASRRHVDELLSLFASILENSPQPTESDRSAWNVACQSGSP